MPSNDPTDDLDICMCNRNADCMRNEIAQHVQGEQGGGARKLLPLNEEGAPL
jgi:hypothetical protein